MSDVDPDASRDADADRDVSADAEADADASTDADANGEPDAVPADPHGHLRADPELGPLVAEHGELTLEPAADPFRRLVVSVCRQQVSMDAAAAIRERLFDRIEVTPAGVLAADEAVLREAGLSAAKAGYLRDLAATWDERGYSRASFEGMADEAVLAELTDVRGIGDWTAKMFLMFGLAREDVFPVEDLGIRKGMWALYGEDMDREGMYETAERWRPYRSYASRYIWRAYDG